MQWLQRQFHENHARASKTIPARVILDNVVNASSFGKRYSYCPRQSKVKYRSMLRKTRLTLFSKILLSLLLAFSACAPLPPLPPLTAGTPEPSVTPSPSYTLLTHPDGALYAGDLVSLEVLSPTAFIPMEKSISVSLAGKILDIQRFAAFGVGNRSQVTFYWLWDTHGLQAGSYTLTFTVLPKGQSWEKTVELLPAAERPVLETKAQWKTADSLCCSIHYISGTDSEVDIETLKSMLDSQAANVEQRMSAKFNGKIPFTLIPRTLGHGGFTRDEIYVSYLHQNYAGSSTALVTHHEMVHWLDSQLGGELRPSIITEGLAVYLSDGHFKVEPILPRAAALIELGWFLPLRQLTDSFYTSQHEIGYAEAAALVSYLVSTYGWDEFNAMYQDVHQAASGFQSDALDAALQAHFKITLEQLEQDFTNFLRQQPVDDVTRTDLRLTVAFYDTVRRYQRQHDPSAYFLNAWLPDVMVMRQRGIVADFLRHPTTQLTRQVEALLVSGDANLRAADYGAAEADIRAANLLLDLAGRFSP